MLKGESHCRLEKAVYSEDFSRFIETYHTHKQLIIRRVTAADPYSEGGIALEFRHESSTNLMLDLAQTFPILIECTLGLSLR